MDRMTATSRRPGIRAAVLAALVAAAPAAAREPAPQLNWVGPDAYCDLYLHVVVPEGYEAWFVDYFPPNRNVMFRPVGSNASVGEAALRVSAFIYDAAEEDRAAPAPQARPSICGEDALSETTWEELAAPSGFDHISVFRERCVGASESYGVIVWSAALPAPYRAEWGGPPFAMLPEDVDYAAVGGEFHFGDADLRVGGWFYPHAALPSEEEALALMEVVVDGLEICAN